MKYKGRKQSSNIDDRRGGVKRVGAGIGIGAILIAVVSFLMGGDPGQILMQLMNQSSQGTTVSAPYQSTEQESELAEFVGVTLQDTEDVWNTIFRQEYNKDYPEPTLVMFNGSVSSACGNASAASGPFYCPGDQQVYIDLSFYNDLKRKFGVTGDFAMAYVIAHEVGHHVQNVLGISRQVQSQRGRVSKEEYNKLSVKLELQADFLAGVWARYNQEMKNVLEKGDIEEALRAAHAIGDDHIQKRSQGFVVPESFTHGTSEQRMNWFMKGYKTGDLSQGDTFSDPTI